MDGLCKNCHHIEARHKPETKDLQDESQLNLFGSTLKKRKTHPMSKH